MKHAIKRLSDQGGLRIGGYLVVFGDPTKRDLHGEWFTPHTYFGLDWDVPRPVLYHHGQDKAIGPACVGVINTLKLDEAGVWAEAQLDQHHAYVDHILALIEQGVLAWSSGALNYLVKIKQSGEIVQWPIGEGSLTPTPAEPFHRTGVRQLKSVIGDDPTFTPLIERLDAKAEESGPAPTPNGSDSGSAPADPHPSGVPDADVTPDPQPSTPPTDEAIPEQFSSGDVEVTDPAGAAAPTDSPAPTPEQPAESTDSPPRDETEPVQTEDETPMNELQMILEAVLQVLGVQLTDDEMTALLAQVQQMIQPAPEQDMTAQMLAEALNDSAMRTAIIEAARKAKRPPAVNINHLTGLMVGTAQAMQEAGTGSGGQSRANGHSDPTNMRHAPQVSGYSRWERAGYGVADMAYYLQIKRMKNPAYDPGEAFFNEMATRGQREIAAKSLIVGPDGQRALELMQDGYYGLPNQRMAKKDDEVASTGQTNFNEEWVPDLWFGGIWVRQRQENRVAPLFRTIEMPSNPFNYPIDGVDPVMHASPETTNQSQLAYTSGNPTPLTKAGSDKLVMTAGKLSMYIAISSELEEDGVLFSVLGQQREQAMIVARNTIDFVSLNADTTLSGNINKDGGTPDATDSYMYGGGDGLLKVPLTADTQARIQAGGTVSLTLLRALRNTFSADIYEDTDNMAYICDKGAYNQMLDIPQFVTVDKMGPNATVLTGMIGAVDGIPVIMSAQLRASAANGKVSSTAGANTRGRVALVYRPYRVVGYRRNVQVTTTFNQFMDAHLLKLSLRMAQVGRPERHVALLYDIAV